MIYRGLGSTEICRKTKLKRKGKTGIMNHDNMSMLKKIGSKKETNREKLERIAKRCQGKIINDSQYGSVVHISPFHCVTKDGVHIYEWP